LAFVRRAKAELRECKEVADWEETRDRLADEAEAAGLPSGNVHHELAKLRSQLRPTPASPLQPQLSIVRASDVPPERVEWVWEDRIPKGKTSFVEGDPGLGKSMMCTDLAARVTSGRPMPMSHEPQDPGTVLLVSSEDGIADTIVPRLQTHGADLSRVRIIQGVPVDDDFGTSGPLRPFVIPGDVGLLRNEVLESQASLVIIDPLMAHLFVGVNSYRDQDVRAALAPLSALAEETGVAIVFVRHLVKSRAGQAIHQGGGSIGFIASARSALVVVADPEDPDSRIVASQKNNLARPRRSLRFTFEVTVPGGPARIRWGAETDYLAAGLLSDGDTRDRNHLADAVEFLEMELAEGPVWVEDLKSKASRAGHTWITIRRAKEKVGAKSHRDGVAGRWVWHIPEHQGAQGVLLLGAQSDEHLEQDAPEQGKGAYQPSESPQDAHSREMSTLGSLRSGEDVDEAQVPRDSGGTSLRNRGGLSRA
jgi:hypothetical protein